MAFLVPALPTPSTIRRRPAVCMKRRDGSLPGNPDAKKYRVTVHDPAKNVTHVVDVPEDRYIWSVMEEAGKEVPTSCRNGCCTTCAVRISDGSVKQDEALGLLKEMRGNGYGLLCVSYPQSDVECTLQNEDEVYVAQFGSSFESGGIEMGSIIPDEDH